MLQLTPRVLALALCFLCVSRGAASAHAVVFPGEAPVGARQRYTLRVPNERAFATIRVVITFPSGVRVSLFEEVAGWTLETVGIGEGGPVTSATWTGTLPVGRFVELGFIGVNPEEPTTLKWDVVQTYTDGTEVAWTGPEGSSTPASLTRVTAPVGAVPVGESQPQSVGTMLGGAALLVALLSLGLSLRAKQS